MSHADGHGHDRIEALRHALAHAGHHLPGQAPLQLFVHHNTLHGDQHLPFEEAVEAARRRTGARGYYAESTWRAALAAGRLDDHDLRATIAERLGEAADDVVATVAGRPLRRGELVRLALVHDLDPIPASRLRWQLAEGAVDPTTWAACAESLGVPVEPPHPELLGARAPGDWDTRVRRAAVEALAEAGRAALVDGVGAQVAHLEPWAALSGLDLDALVHDLLVPRLGAYLDEGVARWTPEGRHEGLWAWFRRTVQLDRGLALDGLGGLATIVADRPDDPVEALASLLDDLGVSRAAQEGDVERTALRLPGWAGMAGWHDANPNYAGHRLRPYDLASFLAVRVAIEAAVIRAVAAPELGVEPTLPALDAWYRSHADEVVVRLALHSGDLPPSLDDDARALAAGRVRDPGAWRGLSGPVAAWREALGGDRTAHGDAWPLHQLVRALGVSAQDVRRTARHDLLAAVDAVRAFDVPRRGPFWLEAFERHYRDRFLHGLACNHGRYAPRVSRPTLQVSLCIDDREEAFRRHLEEIEPGVETFGVAGFYGVAMRYLGLGETVPFPLCPVVQDPPFLVTEVPRPGAVERPPSLRERLLATVGVAPLRHVSTHLVFQALAPDADRSPERPQPGFTDVEQADRVQNTLKQMGLTRNQARLIVLLGHGGSSRNNPHFAAYDCGACSGRHGGPNARLFAAMANRPEVRALLRERGLDVPDDTWFLGGDHDTTSEDVVFFDLEDLPATHRDDVVRAEALLREASRRSAHERARKFASAPKDPDLDAALRHSVQRSRDFRQARPELGHATNAAAIVGRRELSQGLFLDRRSFLISYDPTIDPDGTILEGILLAVGPVGAGINLEYYFSSVDNEKFGCGTKVAHNLSGMLGVMSGGRSDLRTGLPKQMIEVHEAMRLLLVVEASTETLGRIHAKHAPLRELIDNVWLQLVSVDPDTGAIHRFLPGRGFERWEASLPTLPHVPSSVAWYRGQGDGFLEPALIGGGAP